MGEKQKYREQVVDSHQYIGGSTLGLETVKWVQQVRHPIATGKLGNQLLKIGGHSKAKILDTEIYCLLKLDCLPCLTIIMLAIFDEWICEDFLK